MAQRQQLDEGPPHCLRLHPTHLLHNVGRVDHRLHGSARGQQDRLDRVHRVDAAQACRGHQPVGEQLASALSLAEGEQGGRQQRRHAVEGLQREGP